MNKDGMGGAGPIPFHILVVRVTYTGPVMPCVFVSVFAGVMTRAMGPMGPFGSLTTPQRDYQKERLSESRMHSCGLCSHLGSIAKAAGAN